MYRVPAAGNLPKGRVQSWVAIIGLFLPGDILSEVVIMLGCKQGLTEVLFHFPKNHMQHPIGIPYCLIPSIRNGQRKQILPSIKLLDIIV